jgi:mannose-6-phosphate isomerase-like protein (cupin superfamily)
MTYFANRKNVQAIRQGAQISFPMLTEQNGCTAGFKAGITLYTSTEYSTPGVHDDQEGFIVLEGHGWAKIGDEESRIEPEVCFVAPAGVPHSIRRDLDSEHVKVCWFHGAIA